MLLHFAGQSAGAGCRNITAISLLKIPHSYRPSVAVFTDNTRVNLSVTPGEGPLGSLTIHSSQPYPGLANHPPSIGVVLMGLIPLEHARGRFRSCFARFTSQTTGCLWRGCSVDSEFISEQVPPVQPKHVSTGLHVREKDKSRHVPDTIYDGEQNASHAQTCDIRRFSLHSETR